MNVGWIKKQKCPSARDEAAGTAKQAAAPFSFGARRYASKGPRRLFLPQKCQMSPAFELGADKPGTILRYGSV